METPVRAAEVRRVDIALHGGNLVLSDSGGQHVEGAVNGLAEARVVQHGALLKIRAGGSADVRLAIPGGTELQARSHRGEIVAQVPLGSARVATGSGDVRLMSVSGRAEVTTGSGDIDLTESGSAAQLRSGSGDITVGHAVGSVRVHTASGDITVASNHGQAWLESGSGNVTLGVPEGLATLLDLRSWTGSVAVALPQRDRPADNEGVRVHAATSSGDIRIAPA